MDALRAAAEESHRFLDRNVYGQGLHRNLLEAVDQVTKEHSMADTEATVTVIPPDSPAAARIAALKAAREVMRDRPGITGAVRAVDVTDLHSIAEYILTGEDPWLRPRLLSSATLETIGEPVSGLASLGLGTATTAFRTDPEIAVNAVLDAVRIEVGRLGELGMVPLSAVLRAVEDARPVPEPDFD